MRVGAGAAVAACLCLAVRPAAADNTIAPLVRPDPATITLPDMTSPPTARDARNYDSYFYFYKAGVSYEAAFADLDQCRGYSLSARLVSAPPRFVPLDGTVVSRRIEPSASFAAQYGVIGVLIAGVIVASAEEDAAIATNRRCMFYKGYRRYGTTRDIAHRIADGTDAEKAARLARLASGAPPQAEAIDP
jgi:hypothetical protein